MRPITNRIIVALLCCTLGSMVCYGGLSLLAGEGASIPALKISSLEAEWSPCPGIDSVSYDEPVITFAPIANYTATASKSEVSGEVRLFCYLTSNKKVSGLAVVRGLPLGLTEEAIKAAKRIKFEPARSCGQPTTEPVEISYDFPSGQSKLRRL
jgi:TonB family protein